MGFPPPNLGRWIWLMVVALALAIVGAVLLARRRRDYAPIAIGLVWVAFAHVARQLLASYVLGSGPAGGLPYQGVERVFFHVEQALFVSWSAGTAALAIRTFVGRGTWIVALVYLVIVAGLAAAYPELRRERLQWAYFAILVASIAVSIGAVIAWARARVRPEPPHIAVFLLLACEIGAVLGPYSAGLIDKTWPIALGLYIGFYCVLAVWQGLWLRRR